MANNNYQLSTQELLRLDRQHVWHPYAVAGPSAGGGGGASSTAGTATATGIPIMDSVVPIESAHGVYLKIRSGSSYDNDSDINKNTTSSHNNELVDGMSNWWATIHGYNHPTLNAAILRQVSHMSHVMFGGLTHEPAIQLCTKLCQLSQLDICFLSDSGSVAVEVAMKMAIQYWNGRHRSMMGGGVPNNNTHNAHNNNLKKKFITVRNGYHGDTFAAMSVCDPINGMHTEQFNGGTLQQQYFVPAPTPNYPHSSSTSNDDENEEFDESHMKGLIETLDQYHMNIAAMIIEPIVQGAGGMRMYHPMYLRRVRDICTQYDILLIYDEIATGFGRTNRMFGHDHCYFDTTDSTNKMKKNSDNNDNEDNNNNNNDESKSQQSHYKPDIMCVGKALTGGYMSLAATITTNHVADMIHSISSEEMMTQSKPVLMHGPTFMGNPLACSVALANLSLLESKPSDVTSDASNQRLPQHTATCTDWRRSVPMIEQQLRNELIECTESEHVHNVRVLGAIGVVEMKHPIRDMKLLQHTIVKEYGVWLRPFGKLIYTMPPFIISPEQLRKITTAMVQLTRRRF